MRFLHLSDLHLGKRVYGFSMLEEQRDALAQVERIAGEREVDAVVVAGDVYDKGVPPTEAVELLDRFWTRLLAMGVQVLAISGNHDSPERLSFAQDILAASGLHVAGVQGGQVRRVRLSDAWGPVDFYLLPFVRPARVAALYPQVQIANADDTVRALLRGAQREAGVRSVLIAHQLVLAPGEEVERCDSETVQIGGTDGVFVDAFDGFDYVALGHLHRAQRVGRDTVRYAGSPLKYSFSEARGNKSVTLVELDAAGVRTQLLPLTPLRDLRDLRGPLRAILEAADGPSEDYVRAVLTDEGPVYDAVGQLRRVYPNVMTIEFERNAPVQAQAALHTADVRGRTPMELFEDFYRRQTGKPLDDGAYQAVQAAVEGAQEEEA